MTNRLIFLAGATLLTLGWLGCSSDSTTPGGGGDASVGDSGGTHDSSTADSASQTDGGGDASRVDGSTANDGGTPMGDAGVTCGNTTCNGGQVCCGTIGDGGTSATLTCMGSCPDGGVTLACDSPAQCTAASPICCADLVVGAGTPPACPFQSGNAGCKSSCTTQIPSSCPGMGRARLCKAGGDCTEPGNTNCCLFSQGGQSATFCVSTLIAGFATQCF